MEGSHTVQNLYELLDIHLGQCFSVLVTADQDPKDYFIVARSRFTKEPHVATATIRYANGNGPASPGVGENPEDQHHPDHPSGDTVGGGRKERYAINGRLSHNPRDTNETAQYYGVEDKVQFMRDNIWGHQLYFSVRSPNRSLKDEYNMPDNDLLCGLIKDLPLPKPYSI
ncbi:hypothetical protein HAX54_026388 [Datura stramonium]|uniref:Plastocyanin-like domain-containing protein n=1 Tax=Datura stramonium TaxID=4076 RepID=A0ABS8RL05_DATST|nr:hypothetical protein [Datura stramonium]